MLSRSPWERFRSDRRAVACLLILCAELLAVLLLTNLLLDLAYGLADPRVRYGRG